VSLPSIAAYNAAASQVPLSPHSQHHPHSPLNRSPLMPSPDPRPPTSAAAMDLRRSAPTTNVTPTSGMDALAEVAALQRPQHLGRQHELMSSSNSIPRSISSRSSVDLIMPEAPPQPRIYTAASLSEDESQAVTEQASRIGQNAFDFVAHTEFVRLLHKGFVAHVESGGDPHTYELVADMQQARQAMDKIFAVGEDIWVDWLNDENMLARSIDDRLLLMEFFHRSVAEEPNSSTLWRLYGDYIYYLWSCSNDAAGDAPRWTSDDKEIGKEIFKWDTVTDIWEQGAVKTQWRLNDSNLVWDRYMEILIDDLNRHPSKEKFEAIRAKFTDRLVKHAHSTWDATFQNFSNFISQHDNASYEQTMVAITERSKQVKKVFKMRSKFEFNIEQALEQFDKDAEWTAYSEYLNWELRMQGVFSAHLINALFERATIRFPTNATLWNDYVEFLIEHPDRDVPVLEVLERGTRHCPWSGDLWSHRLLALEADGQNFKEIEEVKHKATVTGHLEIDSLEGLMKVYIAWCGYLRRRAFSPGASEEELDIADIGIGSALEHVREVGQRKYGPDFKGDPQYRLERIHIKFLTQKGDFEDGRATWKTLFKQQGNNYDFWYRFYIWEMVVWARFAVRESNDPDMLLRTPAEATSVLREALQHLETMDWPEQLVQMYINHCEQHESVQEYRKAIIEARKASKRVAERREREAAAWKTQQEQQQQVTIETEDEAQGAGKRKREDYALAEEQASKKAKAEADPEADSGVAMDQEPKRDREHTVVVVKNLPEDATDIKVRQFFRDCGNVVSIKFIDDVNNSKTATVEFETKEDALYAQTKEIKPFDGQQIKIEFRTGSTLWVANYPPAADEKYIRSLFKDVSSCPFRVPLLFR
jgi:hypothetical protein